MIRLVFLLRLRPGLSLAEFHDDWLNRHGPLVASFSSDLKLLRYVQTHTLDGPANLAAQKARGEMEPHYDGVAELWWSTEDDLQTALQSDAGKLAGAALLADEARFIDLPESPLWFAYEYPQVNPTPENIEARVKSNIQRVFFPLRQQTHLTEAQACHYWLTQHGPIVRASAAAAGMLCYRQVHRANSPLDAALQEARGTRVESYLGHAEAWVDLGRAPATNEAKLASKTFIKDEHNFIDMARSTIWMGKEHTIIDKR